MWGGPFKEGTLTLDQLDEILTQVALPQTVERFSSVNKWADFFGEDLAGQSISGN